MDNGKLAGPATPPSKIKEVTYKEVHELLQYVDKTNPTGPEPADPTADPQYSAWEAPVQQWAQKQGYLTDVPPTEIDTTYSTADQPSINWTSLQDGATITSLPITLSSQASGPHGVAKVTYLLNNQIIGTATQAPYTFAFTPNTTVQNGTYTLSARATDSLGDEQQNDITVTINLPPDPNAWSINWIAPEPNATYALANVPTELQIGITNPQRIKKIDFYYANEGAPHFIGFQNVSGQTQLNEPWIKPDSPGTYQLYLVVTDIHNQSMTDPLISISVTN